MKRSQPQPLRNFDHVDTKKLEELRDALRAGHIKLTGVGFTARETPREDFSGWARFHEQGTGGVPPRPFFSGSRATTDDWTTSARPFPAAGAPTRRPPFHQPWCAHCRKFCAGGVITEIKPNGDKLFSVHCHGDVQRVRVFKEEVPRVKGYGIAFSGTGANQW